MVCSGHGIIMAGDECLCDLGYNGRNCESQTLQEIKDVIPSSVAIFTDSFGPLNSRDVLSLYYESLANNLKKNGHTITVIYTGKLYSQFSKVSNIYDAKGIHLVMLEAENNFITVEQKSFAAYSYLRSLTNDFSTVIFSSSSHTAFYTLNTVHQGLYSSDTNFVLSLDDLTEKDAETNAYHSKDHVVKDIPVLKKHFMTMETVKKAVRFNLIFISQKHIISLDQELISFYNLKEFAELVPHSPILETSSNFALKSWTSMDEIVFISGRNNLNGLDSFCDAIDQLITKPPFSSVTFFLSERDINGMPAKDYIQFRAEKWEKVNIQWKVLIDQDYPTVVKYFEDIRRVAVLPSVFGGASIIKAELSGLPILSLDFGSLSDKSKIKDIIGKAILGKELQAVSSKVDYSNIWKNICTKKNTNNPKTDTVLPLVSVILVHHNRPELLKQAISSLEKQTYTNFEVVLVDDGSTDPAAIAYIDELSWKWWEEKGWKVIREPNRYLGASRNTGVKHANGKYVLFMDDDDYAKPHQIETFVKVALATKAPVMTSGHDIFNGQAPPTGQSSLRYTPIGGDVLSGMLENVFGDSAMFVEKEYFVESGGFTEEFGVGFEDYEYLAKVALRGDNMEAIAEPLHWYRIHQGTMSEATKLKSNQLRVLRAYSSFDFTAKGDQKNLLLYIRDNFLKEGDLDKRQFSDYSLIFSSNVTHPVTPAATPAVIPPAESQTPVFVDSAVIDFVDPAYIFDSAASNFAGVSISRKVFVVARNYSAQSIVKIRKSGGGMATIPVSEIKTNPLNNSQSVLVFNQAAIDKINGPVTYEKGQIVNPIYFFMGKSHPVPVYYSSFSNFGTRQIKYGYNLTYFGANIWMENLIDTPTPFCIIKRGNENELEFSPPAVYDINSGQIMCVSHLKTMSNQTSQVSTIRLAVSPSKPVRIDNSISWDDYAAMISLHTKPFVFEYADVAPVMLSAVFHDSGAFVLVKFDKSIIIRGEHVSSDLYCSEVFVNRPSNSTILSIAKENCLISKVNPTTIKLTFDGKFLSQNPVKVIKPFDSLILQRHTIYNSQNVNPFTGAGSSGFVIVQPPLTPPSPSLNIQSSFTIGGCSDFIMSFSRMAGSGGRPFVSLAFSVSPSRGAKAFRSAAELEKLLNYASIDVLMGKRSQIIISVDQLASIRQGSGVEPGSYNISVSVKNFWGVSELQTLSYTFTQDKALPNVILNGPGTSDVDPRKDNSIFAKVTVITASSCKWVSEVSYKFKWVLQGQLRTKIESKSSSLIIQSLQLQPGSKYNASLTISVYVNNQVKVYSYGYVFTTRLDSFISSLGSNKEIGNSQALTLVPQINNEYYRNINFSNYELFWDCYEGSQTKCRDKNGTIIDLKMFLKQPAKGSPFIQIPSGTFFSGDFDFTVNATNKITGVVGSSKITSIKIVSGVVPDVTLASTSIRPSSFDGKFEISAKVAKSSVSSLNNLEFLWKSETECDGTSYVQDSMEDSNLVVGKTSPVLKFKTGHLTAGASYCFSLRVVDKATRSNSSSYIAITIKSHPSNGVCVSENQMVGDTITMTSLVDTFLFSCSSWVTDVDSYPIYYSFQMKKQGSASWITVSRNSPSPSLAMDLLEGKYQVRALISDQSGAKALSPVSVNVDVTGFSLKKRQLSDGFYNFIGEWLTKKSASFNKTQNLDQFISDLATIGSISFNSTMADSHKNLQSISLNSIKTMVDSGLISFDEDSVGYLVSQIQTFTGANCSISSENANSSLQLTYEVLGKANETTFELDKSLSSSVLDAILKNLGNLECASGDSPSVDLLEKKNSIYQKVSAIALRRAGCGEVSYETEIDDLHLKVGKELSPEFLQSSTRSIGHFNLTLSNDNLSKCLSYVTGQKSSSGLKHPSNDHIDGNIYQMSYVDDSGIPQNFSSNIDVEFTSKLTQKSLLNANNPVCSYLKFKDDQEDMSTAELSQEGCVVVSINTINGTVGCKCSHLSDFLVAFNPIPIEVGANPTSAPGNPNEAPPNQPKPTNQPTATPKPDETGGSGSSTTTIIAAAVGGSIGAILVVGAALYIGLKVLPKRSKYSPGQEYDTKSDQVMIGIPGPIPGPSNDKDGYTNAYLSDVKNADFS